MQVQFLQLYVEKDRDASAATVKAANELGFQGLFLTVDSAGIGKRERDLRTTPGGSAPRSAAYAPDLVSLNALHVSSKHECPAQYLTRVGHPSVRLPVFARIG